MLNLSDSVFSFTGDFFKIIGCHIWQNAHNLPLDEIILLRFMNPKST